MVGSSALFILLQRRCHDRVLFYSNPALQVQPPWSGLTRAFSGARGNSAQKLFLNLVPGTKYCAFLPQSISVDVDQFPHRDVSISGLYLPGGHWTHSFSFISNPASHKQVGLSSESLHTPLLRYRQLAIKGHMLHSAFVLRVQVMNVSPGLHGCLMSEHCWHAVCPLVF